MIDFVRDQGARLFGTRIRRLSEAVDRAVAELYRDLDVRFEPRWAALVNYLAGRDRASVTEAAYQLGQTHVAVVQVVNMLVREGLAESVIDPADRRRRILRLTEPGRELARNLEPVWTAVAEESDALLREAPLFLDQLERLELALDERPLAGRLRSRLRMPARRHRA
jgi:DNA-binding MarR family transcriptional regulator